MAAVLNEMTYKVPSNPNRSTKILRPKVNCKQMSSDFSERFVVPL